MADFLNSETLLMDLGLVGAEVVLLIILFIFINFLIYLGFKMFYTIPFVKKLKDKFETIRQNIKWILVFLCFAISLALAGFNAFLIYKHQEEGLLAYHQLLLLKIPTDVWIEFGIGIAKIIGVIILATVAVRILRKVLNNVEARAKAWEGIKANDESIELFSHSLSRIMANGIWLLVFVFAVWTLPYLSFLSPYLFLIFKVYIIISLGSLAVGSVAVIVDSLDALSVKYSSPDNFLSFYEHVRELVPLFRSSLEYIIYVTVATLVVMQVEFVAPLAKYGPKIVQVIGIFFLARAAVVLSGLIADKFFVKHDNVTETDRQRQLTVLPLVKSVSKYSIFFIAFVLMLRSFDINPAAILAGAGIVGIVVGLGAQSLINDLVSGFFILFENIYLVNDYIESEDARGKVEGIDIRTTRIRDPNGQLHIIRNGLMGKIINYSKSYTYAVVEVGVAYDSELDQVYRVLRKTGEKLKEKNPDVIEPTVVQGLDNFGESELTIRTTTRVKPGRHLEVARDYRKMIKEAFDLEGIEIPFARQVIIFKNSPENRG
ncbi:MAG: mechanosensitive ion channel family protein [Candidatus Margulisiibacteriota bacterium]|nr:mechanosensitive ion channel family protein [Candidatus Margulisiibacteriota bacterium]